MKNIFDQNVTAELIERLDKLTPETKQLWGKMSVSKMLAHCNVAYEMVYDNIHKPPTAFMKMVLQLLIKERITNEKPYKKNNPTAPQFIIKYDKDFETEKKRLVAYIEKTQQLGEEYFDGKKSLSLGKLDKTQWNNMFYKHLDHHLTQFGV